MTAQPTQEELDKILETACYFARVYTSKYAPRFKYKDLLSMAYLVIREKWHMYDPRISSMKTYFGYWIWTTFRRESLRNGVAKVSDKEYSKGMTVKAVRYDDESVIGAVSTVKPLDLEYFENEDAGSFIQFLDFMTRNEDDEDVEMFYEYYANDKVLKELGKKYGCSKEWVRQRADNVLGKIRRTVKLHNIREPHEMLEYVVRRKKMFKGGIDGRRRA